MSRGLSQLQKSILEMAYDRFVEAEREQNEDHYKYFQNPVHERGFEGLVYNVCVGPYLPEIDVGWDAEEKRTAERVARDPWEPWDVARERAREELEEWAAERTEKRQEVEENIREAVPELWEEVTDAYYRWSPPSWDTWGRFELASFYNNTAEARRYQKLVDERGLSGGYYWRGGGFLYTGEILEHVFAFEPKHKEDYCPWGQRNAIKFDPEEVGKKRYNSARATVSRATKRLYDRMLIEDSYGVITITVEGIAAITGRTVDEVCAEHKLDVTDGARHMLIDEHMKWFDEASRRMRDEDEDEDSVGTLQRVFGTRPPPLADQLHQAIVEHIASQPGGVEVGEVNEAYEEAIQRIVEEQEETVKESCTVRKP